MHILVPIVMIVLIAVLVLVFCNSSQRDREVAAWAGWHGLSFDPPEDPGMPNRFRDLRCLQEGGDRYAYNVMRGEWDGLPITAFDYHYGPAEGRGRSSYIFSAVIIESPGPLRPLCIRRRQFLDRASKPLRFKEIDFGSSGFGREFRVTSPDEEWARAVLHPQMTAYLMSAPDFAVQLGDRSIIAWNGSCLGDTDFEAAANLITGILERIPGFPAQEQRGAAGRS